MRFLVFLTVASSGFLLYFLVCGGHDAPWSTFKATWYASASELTQRLTVWAFERILERIGEPIVDVPVRRSQEQTAEAVTVMPQGRVQGTVEHIDLLTPKVVKGTVDLVQVFLQERMDFSVPHVVEDIDDFFLTHIKREIAETVQIVSHGCVLNYKTTEEIVEVIQLCAHVAHP